MKTCKKWICPDEQELMRFCKSSYEINDMDFLSYCLFRIYFILVDNYEIKTPHTFSFLEFRNLQGWCINKNDTM